jgi:hypothetical protein
MFKWLFKKSLTFKDLKPGDKFQFDQQTISSDGNTYVKEMMTNASEFNSGGKRKLFVSPKSKVKKC